VSTLYSDKIICSFSLSSLDSNMNSCSVQYYDIVHFNAVNRFTFELPKTAQIKYCSPETVFYIDRFNLYAYDPVKKKHEKMNDNDFKCVNVSQTGSNSLLLLGEEAVDSSYRFGYFRLDLTSKKRVLAKELERNKATYAAPNSLIYSGKFVRIDSSNTCYYCDKYSKIFFFNNDAQFVKVFTTNDNTPRPELVSTGDAFFYKRGNTFNVNNALYSEKNKLFVFSCRSSPVKYLMIDIYSLQTGKYLNSTRLAYNDWNCPDIVSVSNAGKNAIINFQHGTALFNLQE
jgi:hypothetical protein